MTCLVFDKNLIILLDDNLQVNVMCENLIPAKVKKILKPHEIYRTNRVYRFRKIIKVGLKRKNEYVICIVAGIDEQFKIENKTETIRRLREVSFKILRFCC